MNIEGNFPTYEKQEAIKNLVDEVKRTTDSTKTEVTNSRTVLNTVNTTVNTLLEGRTVKGVQRGSISLANMAPNPSVTISAVNMNKAILTINTSAGHDNVGAIVAGYLASSTQINLTRGNANTSALAFWQVIEFY